MKLEHEAVVRLHSAAQRLDDLLAIGLQPTPCEIGKGLRIVLTGDDRLEKRPAARAQNVADDADDFDVGIFQRLLDALRMPSQLAHQLLSRAGEIAKLLNLRGWHKAA